MIFSIEKERIQELVKKNLINFFDDGETIDLFWFSLYQSFLKKKRNLKHIDTHISISEFVTDQLIKNGVEKNRIKSTAIIQLVAGFI